MNQHERTRRLAICAVLCALGVVILWLGAVLDILDLTMAALAPVLVIYVVIEIGGFWPWLVYLVTGLLALLLLPQKLGAVFYLLCTGFYPIIKRWIEGRLPRFLGLVAKLLVFNLSAGLILLVAKAFALDLSFEWAPYLVVLFVEFTFLLYDIVLTRLISLYTFHWRKKFRLK